MYADINRTGEHANVRPGKVATSLKHASSSRRGRDVEGIKTKTTSAPKISDDLLTRLGDLFVKKGGREHWGETFEGWLKQRPHISSY